MHAGQQMVLEEILTVESADRESEDTRLEPDQAVRSTKRIKSKPLTDAQEMLAVVQRLCDVCLVKISSEP